MDKKGGHGEVARSNDSAQPDDGMKHLVKNDREILSLHESFSIASWQVNTRKMKTKLDGWNHNTSKYIEPDGGVLVLKDKDEYVIFILGAAEIKKQGTEGNAIERAEHYWGYMRDFNKNSALITKIEPFNPWYLIMCHGPGAKEDKVIGRTLYHNIYPNEFNIINQSGHSIYLFGDKSQPLRTYKKIYIEWAKSLDKFAYNFFEKDQYGL